MKNVSLHRGEGGQTNECLFCSCHYFKHREMYTKSGRDGELFKRERQGRSCWNWRRRWRQQQLCHFGWYLLRRILVRVSFVFTRRSGMKFCLLLLLLLLLALHRYPFVPEQCFQWIESSVGTKNCYMLVACVRKIETKKETAFAT